VCGGGVRERRGGGGGGERRRGGPPRLPWQRQQTLARKPVGDAAAQAEAHRRGCGGWRSGTRSAQRETSACVFCSAAPNTTGGTSQLAPPPRPRLAKEMVGRKAARRMAPPRLRAPPKPLPPPLPGAHDGARMRIGVRARAPALQSRLAPGAGSALVRARAGRCGRKICE
jgi:hypothetical protein